MGIGATTRHWRRPVIASWRSSPSDVETLEVLGRHHKDRKDPARHSPTSSRPAGSSRSTSHFETSSGSSGWAWRVNSPWKGDGTRDGPNLPRPTSSIPGMPRVRLPGPQGDLRVQGRPGRAGRSPCRGGQADPGRAGPALAFAGDRVGSLPDAHGRNRQVHQALGGRSQEEAEDRDSRRARQLDACLLRLQDRVLRPRDARQSGDRLPGSLHPAEVSPRGHRGNGRTPPRPATPTSGDLPEAGASRDQATSRVGHAPHARRRPRDAKRQAEHETGIGRPHTDRSAAAPADRLEAGRILDRRQGAPPCCPRSDGW